MNDKKELLLKYLNELSNHFSCVLFRESQVIFYKNHFPYGLFILSEGMIEISEKHKKAKVAPISIVGKNAFFKKACYTNTAKTLTKSKLYFLTQDNYLALESNKHPIIDLIKEYDLA